MKSADLWGPIDPSSWKTVPCIVGRMAEEQDVVEGLAVFFLKNYTDFGGKHHAIALPHFAIWTDPETSEQIPGIIIQAEHGDGQILVGFRPLVGGNVVGLLGEFQLLDGPQKLVAGA